MRFLKSGMMEYGNRIMEWWKKEEWDALKDWKTDRIE
jgi:hypothetical protein